MGKEDATCDHKYDVTGGLCENNDKFAIDRMIKKIEKAIVNKNDYYFDIKDDNKSRIYACTINYLKNKWYLANTISSDICMLY